MDKQTTEALERALAQREAERGEQPATSAAASAKPLYIQDLEERARQRRTTPDSVYQHDQGLLSQPQPTPNCLRPDEVMRGARDEKELPHKAWEHLRQCFYCRGLVAAARPDVTRHRQLLSQMAEAEGQAPPPMPTVRWTRVLFDRLDKRMRQATRGGALLVACFLLVCYLSPDWVHTKAPTWAWTDRQLEQHAREALAKGDTEKTATLASKLVERQPHDLDGYLLRYRARRQEGRVTLAQEDLEKAKQLFAQAEAVPTFDVHESTIRLGPPSEGGREEFQEFVAAWRKVPAGERDAALRILTRDLTGRDREVIRDYFRKLSAEPNDSNK